MNNPLFLVFLVPLVADVVGTVTGQKKAYWDSKYKKFEEAVPFIHLILAVNPILFIVVCLTLWLPVTYFLTLYLPSPFNLWAAMSLFAGHSYNSVHWLRSTQKTWGIFSGSDRVSITLSLLPMTLYILIIGYIAALSLNASF